MDLFANKHYTHPQIFANIFDMSAKAFWTLFVRLTFVTYVFGIDPSGVLAQLALPH